jgi:uncharacterized membrane protein
MKSTAQVAGHPIHPMLIPYPFALLTSAAAFEAGARNGRPEWSRTAEHLTNAGLAAALVAAVPGIVDYFGTVRPRTNAGRSATLHAASNVSALLCFAMARRHRTMNGPLRGQGFALMLLGSALLGLGGWLGGQLVYHEHIGVDDHRFGSARLPETGQPRLRRVEFNAPRL